MKTYSGTQRTGLLAVPLTDRDLGQVISSLASDFSAGKWGANVSPHCLPPTVAVRIARSQEAWKEEALCKQTDLRHCLSWNPGFLISQPGLTPGSTQNGERERAVVRKPGRQVPEFDLYLFIHSLNIFLSGSRCWILGRQWGAGWSRR